MHFVRVLCHFSQLLYQLFIITCCPLLAVRYGAIGHWSQCMRQMMHALTIYVKETSHLGTNESRICEIFILNAGQLVSQPAAKEQQIKMNL